jgi:hypothetical protein
MDSHFIGEAEGQMIEGWVTLTPISEEGITAVYGIFEDEESAKNWANQMRPDTTVRPIFTPAFSKG